MNNHHRSTNKTAERWKQASAPYCHAIMIILTICTPIHSQSKRWLSMPLKLATQCAQQPYVCISAHYLPLGIKQCRSDVVGWYSSAATWLKLKQPVKQGHSSPTDTTNHLKSQQKKHWSIIFELHEWTAMTVYEKVEGIFLLLFLFLTSSLTDALMPKKLLAWLISVERFCTTANVTINLSHHQLQTDIDPHQHTYCVTQNSSSHVCTVYDKNTNKK